MFLIATIAALGGAGVILIDAPVAFKCYSTKGEGRSPQAHYNTLTVKQLKALPIGKIAGPHCWLFNWWPNPHICALEGVLEAWGFRFSGSAFCWVKLNPSGIGYAFGGGHTTRKNVELCWLGRRGSPPRLSKSVRELIVAPRREHSRKPDEQYERIEQFCNGPYVELFARQQRPGWLAWGDQVDRFSWGGA